jgi:hypothetical protein
MGSEADFHRMSACRTFRTCRDVQPESEMRSRADIVATQPCPDGLRQSGRWIEVRMS